MTLPAPHLRVLATLLCILTLTAHAQKITIQPSDIVNIKRVSDPAISPNG